ncbi:MAG: hypothetical protein L6Q99_21715 [Planctomycetes bacterium]|nr:hypothetical protein [Planctomycetota bacterium]
MLDLADGSVHLLFDHSPYAVSLMGVAISGDGSVVGCNVASGMALFEWNGTDYVQTWYRDFPGSVRVDVSEDGTTMAYGTGGGYSGPYIVTECVDVLTKTVTMTEDITGIGQYGNWIEDVSISADGTRFVTASWGDEFDLVPEVRVYSKYESAPIQTLNLPGSAITVDLSRDAQWIAVGSRPVHAQLPSIGGRVDLFRMGGSDFTMTTVPAIGSTVTFEIFGQPGRKASLLDSPAMVDPPIAFQAWGLLHLQPSAMTLTPAGVIGPSGSRTITWTLPSDPSWIGTSHYFQGFTNDPKRMLTRDWLVVTYLP